MPERELTHREAVERAWRAAVLAENLLDGGGQYETIEDRARARAAVSRAWSAIASQLPVVDYAGAAVEPVTEFIPRVVEPLAAPLCHCPHGHAEGHARSGYCT